MNKALDRASRLWAGAANAGHDEDLFKKQTGKPGFERALLPFFRSDALNDYSSVYKKPGLDSRKPLLSRGNNDEDIPASHIGKIRTLVPLAAYHELPNIIHGVVFQASTVLNDLLLKHLGAA